MSNSQSSKNSNVSFSPVRPVSIKPDKFNKGAYSLQLQQEKTTAYQSGSGTMKGDFSEIPTSNTYSSKRNYFINNLAFDNQEEVKEWTKKFMESKPNMHIQRVTSHKPILFENHKQAIESGVATLESIANSQLVRNKQQEPIQDSLGRNWYAISILCENYIEDEFIETEENTDSEVVKSSSTEFEPQVDDMTF